MDPAFVRSARLALLALACAAAQPAAAVIYKSVDRNGHVTFSDTPVPGAIATLRIPSSESAKAAVVESPALAAEPALADDADEAVRRANAKVDLAERALALARRSVDPGWSPLSLEDTGRSRADRERVEFFKRDVLLARRSLMAALQQRNALRATG